MAESITDLQSYSYNYLTARFKVRERNPDIQSLPAIAGSQFLIICSMRSQLFKLKKKCAKSLKQTKYMLPKEEKTQQSRELVSDTDRLHVSAVT